MKNISWGSSYVGEPENRFHVWMNNDERKVNILKRIIARSESAPVQETHENNNGKMYTTDFEEIG